MIKSISAFVSRWGTSAAAAVIAAFMTALAFAGAPWTDEAGRPNHFGEVMLAEAAALAVIAIIAAVKASDRD